MEKRDAAGYARMPSQASEFEELESEQVWLEYEGGEPNEAFRKPAATGERTKAMGKALEQAATIREKLEGRNHSVSTQIVSEDRER